MKPRLRPLLLWTISPLCERECNGRGAVEAPMIRLREYLDVAPAPTITGGLLVKPGCLAKQRGHQNPLLARSTITTLSSRCLIERRFPVCLKATWQRGAGAPAPRTCRSGPAWLLVIDHRHAEREDSQRMYPQPPYV
jgi:hypothetical protein